MLVEPEIPQNTGSIARLAAATNTHLDLVGPLGFSLEDRYLKRAGLDYWPFVKLAVHDNWSEYVASCPTGRALAFSARRGKPYTECAFEPGDRMFFGKETKGLGADLLDDLSETTYRIPIDNPGVRSLNLANSVAIVLYEARRQLGLGK